MKQFSNGYISGAITAFLGAGAFAALAQTPTPGGSAFYAPFFVLGESGEAIVMVEERAGGAVMTLNGNNGSTITLGANGDRLAIDMRTSATNHASLILDGEETALSLESGGNGLLLSTDATQTGISVNRGEVEIGHFGKKDGKDSALRIFSPSGKPAVELGSSAGRAGAGTIRVHDAAGNMAGFLQGTEQNGGNAGILHNGAIVVLLDVTPSGSGGKVEAAEVNGRLVFRAGAQSSGGRAMCLYTDKGDRCYGPYLP